MGALGAELGFVEGLFVRRHFRRVRVEVERFPGCCEGIGRVSAEVLFHGELEAVLADVAPGADGVGDDGDVVLRHGAGCCAERHGRWLRLAGLVVCCVY
jgi:hypothetical protein